MSCVTYAPAESSFAGLIVSTLWWFVVGAFGGVLGLLSLATSAAVGYAGWYGFTVGLKLYQAILGRLDTLETVTKALDAEIKKETSARIEAIILVQKILDGLKTGLAHEKKSRIDAVKALKAILDLERQARDAGDRSLRNLCDHEKNDRLNGDRLLRDLIDHEEADRIAGDTILLAALDKEKGDRQADEANLNDLLNKEQADRTTKEGQLTRLLDQERDQRQREEARFSEILTKEHDERTAEESNLTRLLDTERQDRVEAVEAEAQRRSAEETALSQQLEQEKQDRAKNEGNLTKLLDTEKSERLTDEERLKATLDRERAERATAEAALNSQLEKERQDRATAEAALATKVEQEKSERAAVESKLTSDIAQEKTDRAAKEAQLGAELEKEKQDRIAEGASLSTKLAEEQVAREEGDKLKVPEEEDEPEEKPGEPPKVRLKDPIAICGDLNGSPANFDDNTFTIELPVEVSIFGFKSRYIGVSTNGVLELRDSNVGSMSTALRGTLPVPDFGAAVLPLFCDLMTYKDTQQGIFWASDNSAGAGKEKIIFEFYLSRYQAPTEFYHFQVIFDNAKPDIITVKYFNVTPGVQATVGAQGKNKEVVVVDPSQHANVVKDRTTLTINAKAGASGCTYNTFGSPPEPVPAAPPPPPPPMLIGVAA